MNVKFEKHWLRRYLFVGMAALSMLILNSNSAFAAVIAHYDFEGDLIDKSPLGGHDGTGGATFVDSGTFSGMAYDVGAGGHIVLDNPNDFLGYGGQDGFDSHAAGGPADTVTSAAGLAASMAMRFRPVTSNEAVLWGFGSASNVRFHFAQRTRAGVTDAMRLEYGGGAYRSLDTPTSSLLPNRWYTAVAVQDGAPDSGWTIHMREDGGAVQTYSTFNQTNGDHQNAPNDNTNEFTRHIEAGGTVEIGGLPNIVDSIDWGGLVDDFAFFDTALSQSDVDTIMASGLGAFIAGTPPPTEGTWNADGSGDWNSGGNWVGAVPNGNDKSAILGDKISSPQTVFTNAPVTVKSIQFNSDNGYAVAGQGVLNLERTDGNAAIVVGPGSHQFQLPVNLNTSTDLTVADGASLQFNHLLSLNGNTFTKLGTGNLEINNNLTTGDGTLMNFEGTIAGVGSVSGDLVNNLGVISPGAPDVAAAQSVPEPSCAALLLAALTALVAASRRIV